MYTPRPRTRNGKVCSSRASLLFSFALLVLIPRCRQRCGDGIPWCEKYILPRLKTEDGKPLTALDLYGARCGILHTSTSVSSVAEKGEARQISYQFQGQTGLNLGLNAKLEPTTLDTEHFVRAFEEGGRQFISVLNDDLPSLQTARTRALSFFRWVT